MTLSCGWTEQAATHIVQLGHEADHAEWSSKLQACHAHVETQKLCLAVSAEAAGKGKGRGGSSKKQSREMPTDEELQAAFDMLCPSGTSRIREAELFQVR